MSYCFTSEYTIMELLNNSSFAPFNSTKDLFYVTWTGLIQMNFKDGGDDPSALTPDKNKGRYTCRIFWP
jgi:hypothetical protein